MLEQQINVLQNPIQAAQGKVVDVRMKRLEINQKQAIHDRGLELIALYFEFKNLVDKLSKDEKLMK